MAQCKLELILELKTGESYSIPSFDAEIWKIHNYYFVFETSQYNNGYLPPDQFKEGQEKEIAELVNSWT